MNHIEVAFNNPQVSVVVPVYKNQDTLCELHGRLSGVLADLGISYEIIFVNDASPDESLTVLNQLSKEDRNIRVVVQKNNIGQQRAVLAGLARSRAGIVVVMDADLQDPPEGLPKLLHYLKGDVACVFGGRRGKYESSMRLLTSQVFKYLLHLLCGTPKDAGIFVAMKKEMVYRLLGLKTRFPYLVAMIGCTGLPVVSVPVERDKRLFEKSTYSFWMRLSVAMQGLACAFIWKLNTMVMYAANRKLLKKK